MPPLKAIYYEGAQLMNENKNNGLNEFNKKNIELRNARMKKRTIQKCAVLTVFLLLIAILTAILWLAILDISENIGNKLPQDETGVPTDDSAITTPSVTNDPTVTTTTGNDEVTTPTVTDESTTPIVTEPALKVTYKTFTQAQMHSGNLILVNEEHPFVIPADMDSRLDRIANYKPAESKALYFRATNVRLLPSVSVKLYEMADANFADTKINDLCLTTTGAYRTFDEQQALYASNQSNFPGGCSDFNTGLAVYFIGWRDDGKTFEFDNANYESGSTLAEWFETKSYKYGFIKRFSASKVAITGQPEAVGMYRYVGYVHAYNMIQNNLCLEEYLNAISKYTFEGQHYQVTADDGHKYEIYYVASAGDTTSVPVPEAYPYEVSGDNIGGYIVTVTLD